MLRHIKKEYEIIFLILLEVIFFSPFIGYGVISDDFMHIYHVSRVRGFIDLFKAPGPFGLYRPVTELLFFMNYKLGELKNKTKERRSLL